MNSYLINFSVYSFAMLGFLLALVFIYKKSVSPSSFSNRRNFLEIQSSLRLSPSKTLYVIKAGSEKFLISADPANTALIAKLENSSEDANEEEKTPKYPEFSRNAELGSARHSELVSESHPIETLKPLGFPRHSELVSESHPIETLKQVQGDGVVQGDSIVQGGDVMQGSSFFVIPNWVRHILFGKTLKRLGLSARQNLAFRSETADAVSSLQRFLGFIGLGGCAARRPGGNPQVQGDGIEAERTAV